MQKTVIVLSIIILSSCLKKIDIDSASQNHKLVINSFISNQDIIRVHLSESLGQLEEKSFEVKENAEVKILDANGNLLENLSYLDNGFESYYYSSFIPSIGIGYQISASFPNYETVTSKTTVPNLISNLSFDTNTLLNGVLSVNISFDDHVGKGDKYMISVYSFYENVQYNSSTGQYDTTIQKNPTSFESFSPYFEEASSSEGFYYGDAFMTDHLFNGESVTFNLKVDNYYDNGLIEIKKVTEEYYNHKYSLRNYNYTNGDPFSEPVRVFSNIENGYGIFAGYNSVELKF